ncbi:MAG: pyridoxal 5'-phosphate synthase glutaminase subunit PdxT [Anaerolineaceae bacterium]|jgi:5'-phosphate synthase pdxT subunit
MKIGILALQGDFREHQTILEALGCQVQQVRLAKHLEGCDGLIIPGGESTTFGKLAVEFNLMDALKEFGKNHGIWGTCAGAIFLSKDARRSQPLLNLMDIQVARNAFGRQVDSFEIDLEVAALARVNSAKGPFHAVFIRAPLIEKVSGDAHVLATLPDGRIVAAEQGKLLATSFHPELTADHRFHRYFLELLK